MIQYRIPYKAKNAFPMSPMVKEILLQLTCLLPLARLTPYTMILKLTHLNPSAPSFIAETRVSGSQAERLFRSLGYNDMHIVDAVGFSGRLWMIWNSDQVTIFLMPDGTQAIHAVCKVTCPNQNTLRWLISGIYANPRLSNRKLLWENWLISEKL